MRAFVTGATGFIGSHLVNRLLTTGWKVTVLIRNPRDSAEFSKKGVHVVIGDIVDQQAVHIGVHGSEVIFNLAAALPHNDLSPKAYWNTNVIGAKNLVKAYERTRIKRIVHVSTVGIYGITPRIGTDESFPRSLPDAYSRTKAKAEDIMLYNHKRSGLPVVIIRPTIAYGPGDTRPVFLSLFRLIKRGIFIPIGRGENFFHTIYVDNLIDALILSVNKNVIGEDFIIGDDPCPTMQEILSTIAAVQGTKLAPFYLPIPIAFLVGRLFDLAQKVGLPAPLTTQRVRFMTNNKNFTIEEAKNVLGYKPKIGLVEGIRKTFEWYKKNGYLS